MATTLFDFLFFVYFVGIGASIALLVKSTETTSTEAEEQGKLSYSVPVCVFLSEFLKLLVASFLDRFGGVRLGGSSTSSSHHRKNGYEITDNSSSSATAGSTTTTSTPLEEGGRRAVGVTGSLRPGSVSGIIAALASGTGAISSVSSVLASRVAAGSPVHNDILGKPSLVGGLLVPIDDDVSREHFVDGRVSAEANLDLNGGNLDGHRVSPTSSSSGPWLDWLRYGVPALLYCIQNNLDYYATIYLGPALFFLLLNIRIVFSALLGRLFLRQNVTAVQWLALGNLLLALVVSQLRLLLSCPAQLAAKPPRRFLPSAYLIEDFAWLDESGSLAWLAEEGGVGITSSASMGIPRMDNLIKCRARGALGDSVFAFRRLVMKWPALKKWTNGKLQYDMPCRRAG